LINPGKEEGTTTSAKKSEEQEEEEEVLELSGGVEEEEEEVCSRVVSWVGTTGSEDTDEEDGQQEAEVSLGPAAQLIRQVHEIGS